jgi:hypothetical protein
MFVATALLYPCVLAALCLGTGLLIDRASHRSLAAPLLLAVGAAGLIAVSQLSTYIYVLAPATPYLMLAAALAGFALARARALELWLALRAQPWLAGASVLAYMIALAPVLVAGRTTFSSFMVLSDSAVHLIGADFLIEHGQHFTHLDLRNSAGQFINDYYNSSYPSGADTLFGGSAVLLGLPLIWVFQPFNAFMLASAVGPAWMIARRLGLTGAWAALAALSAVLPALVYAYELFGSVKEIASLPIILALGALIIAHRSWLGRGGAARAIPCALLLAGGVSALGVAFGTWALVSAAVLGAILARELISAEACSVRGALGLIAGALAILAIAAWPTWIELPGSVKVAQDIASTGNPGNLHSPLRAVQVLGVWLGGSYKLAPHGSALAATHILMVLTVGAAVLGAFHLLRRRIFALAGWMALMLLAWLTVSISVSTWAAAKTLMLTSPAVVLLAWGGVAALRTATSRIVSLAGAGLLALCLAGGALASDALQYHVSNLAPTARYQQLASLNSRFAGEGPTLFTDFDEYSMYELRNLDVGGPNFAYPPPALAKLAGGYGNPVRLDRASPSALRAYPLIITRRDPALPRPPAVYRLAWQNSYYQVWRRRPAARAAIEHLGLSGAAATQCRQIGGLAALAVRRYSGSRGPSLRLVASVGTPIIRLPLLHAPHPRGWGHERRGLVMSRAGRLSAGFRVPVSGMWDVWVQGQLMPTVKLAVDGRTLASIGAQLSGNSLVPNTVPPIPLELTAGAHRLWVTRDGTTLAPGEGGAAVLDSVFLTPASAPRSGTLLSRPLTRWRELCGGSYQWVELSGS